MGNDYNNGQEPFAQPGAVDLGLSVKWADRNVGASAPEEYGDYFAWGETEPYYMEGHSQDDPCINWKSSESGYYWDSYKWSLDSEGEQLSKYVTDSEYGSVDEKTTLEKSDDAASANFGGRWRMPTKAEFDELRSRCKWEWASQGNHQGYKVTGPNGNSIFLPAAGVRDDSDLYYVGSYGYYWSSSLRPDNPSSAYYVYFSSNGVGRSYDDRYEGRSVRPVTE